MATKTLKQALRLLTRSNRRTPEQIVQYLSKRGYTWYTVPFAARVNLPICTICPVARFLRDETGIEYRVYVRGVRHPDDVGTEKACTPLPTSVVYAIQELDNQNPLHEKAGL